MNSKKKDFLISISIIYVFCTIVVLYTNNILVSIFGFNQDNFIFITLPLIIFSLLLFLSFTKSILMPLFKSDENLQKNIKETLHELNIPVSTIKMNTQLLEKNIKDEKALKRLSRISQASNNLLKLYENMEYDIKKQIDRIDIQDFYLDEVINNSIEKFYDIKNNIKINSNVPKIRLKTDLNGFERMIDNLISNAIKYNIDVKPVIKIYYENNILSIYNTGKKIDTKNLFIIFEKYFQENSAIDGFGLGLNIVKEFCDRNKIAIKIDTFENGNQFNLDLQNILLR